jgi:hypothetical protein
VQGDEIKLLQSKVASNDELIERLHDRIALLEHRLRVVLTEVKRERENPLPENYVAKTRFAPSAQVLQVAPKNVGRDTVALAVPELRFDDRRAQLVAAPSSSGFFPETGVVKDYQFQSKPLYEEDMRVLRAYLHHKLIDQFDYDAQRAVMMSQLHGGDNFGYTGSNFTHDSDWKAMDKKATKNLLKGKAK